MNEETLKTIWAQYAQRYTEGSEERAAAWENYFFSANIGALLSATTVDDDIDIVEVCHFQNIDDFKYVLRTYWEWVFNKTLTAENATATIESINNRFSGFLDNYIEIFNFLSVEPQLAIEMFFYIFGRKYSSSRTFSEPITETNWQPEISFDVERMLGYFCEHNRKILFSQKGSEWNKYSRQSIIGLTDYFESILPLLSDDFLTADLVDPEGIKRFERRKMTPGERRMRSLQSRVMRLIANLYGYTTEYDKSEGIKEVHCNNDEHKNTIMTIFELQRKRPLFDDLVNKICEAKGKCLKPPKRSVFSKR